MDSKNHKINQYEILLTVVRALATHQGGPGLNTELDGTCELSLLLVLSFTSRGFSVGAPEKNTPDSSKFHSIWKARTRSNQFLRSAPFG